VGSDTGEFRQYFSLYQSEHRSQALPVMSYTPRLFGRNWPTGAINGQTSEEATTVKFGSFSFAAASATLPIFVRLSGSAPL
jgi:hypothetical protein